MTGHRKRVLTPGVGSRYYGNAKDVRMNRPHCFIKELPTPRIIDFMGNRIEFIPHEGTYWIAEEDIEAATGIHVGPVCVFGSYYPELREKPKMHFEVEGRGLINSHDYYSIRTAFHALSGRALDGDREEVFSFMNLLTELQIHQPIHSHTMIGEYDRLNKVLRRRPHLRAVLTLWNEGKTEGEISRDLDISVGKVRSAVLSLQSHGFEVLTGTKRALQKETGGCAYVVPAVTPRVTWVEERKN